MSNQMNGRGMFHEVLDKVLSNVEVAMMTGPVKLRTISIRQYNNPQAGLHLHAEAKLTLVVHATVSEKDQRVVEPVLVDR